MKKLIIIIFLVFLSVASVCAKDKLLLKIGIYNNKPKIYTDKFGKPAGFWVDITNYIAKKENWDIIWVFDNWNNCLVKLKNNEIDIMPDVGITPERKKQFIFNNETVLMSWVRLYKNKNVKIEDIRDLQNKKIAALKGSFDLNGPEGLIKTLKRFEIKADIIQMDSYDKIFNAIQNKTVDAGVVDADYGNINQKKFKKIEKTAIIFQPAKMQYAFPKNSKNSSFLINEIDSLLKKLKTDKNSIYYTSLEKHLLSEKEVKSFPKELKLLLIIIITLAVILIIFNFILNYQVEKKTALLKNEIQKRKLSEEKIIHLNNILYTIRDINQLITRETDRDKLIKNVCNIMIKYQGYTKFWMAIFDNNFKLQTFGQAGSDNVSLQIYDVIAKPEKVSKISGNLKNNTLYIINNPEIECRLCPISEFFKENMLISIKMEISDKLIGLACAAVPQKRLFSQEEQELFKEVMQDIQYALRKIEEQEKVKKIEKKLKKNRENYRILAETIPDIVIIIDLEGKILFVNSKGLQFSGLDEKNVINRNIREVVSPEDMKKINEKFQNRKSGMLEIFVYETNLINKEGEKIPFEVTSAPILDNGKIDKLLIIGHDITNRKKQMETIKKNLLEKEILLKELYHRTKNNMQLISSMISVQARKYKDKAIRESYKEIINKINAMALVHQKLYETKNLTDINLKNYIEDILKLLTGSFLVDTEKISIKMELENITINMEKALNIGLVLNELLTNIFKYAFPDDKKGVVYVSLHKDSENIIHLIIQDNGVGLPKGTNLRESQSMGLQTVFSLIEYKMGGKISYSLENGVKWDISFKS